MLYQLDVIESLDVLSPVMSVFLLIFFIALMIFFYNRHTYNVFLPILLIFLISIVIGVYSMIESNIPFSPFFQLFFILFQFIMFLLFLREFM